MGRARRSARRATTETTWNTDQNARTLIKYDDFRVFLIALAAEARVREHKAEGGISIHMLSEHIQLKDSGRTFNLRSGGLLALDHGVSHDVHALEESAYSSRLPGREEHDVLGDARRLDVEGISARLTALENAAAATGVSDD